jgi:CBS domain containing-hemolysin-like protein
MDFWQTFLNLTILFVIVVLNGCFTAAGFALVKVRSTQIEPLANKGHRRARLAKHILANLDAYVSATQLGNVMTSLALGWLGEPYVARLLYPFFEWIGFTTPNVIQAVSFGVAFGAITVLNVFFGELLPKTLAIQNAYSFTLWFAYPLKAFFFVVKPVIGLLNGAADRIFRYLGIHAVGEAELAHSDEELRLLLAQGKHVSVTSKNLVLNAMDFRLKQARHIMVPRREIVALPLAAPVAKNIQTMRTNKYSRYPVYTETIDNIVGVVHTKDIFKHDRHLKPDFTIDSVLRDATFLPETVGLEKALEVMLQKKTHMLILADEYGSTAGLATLEDVLEELVGTIQDEFDRETPEVTKISDDEFIVDAGLTTNDVERLLNKELSPRDILSIGAFVIEQFGRIPTKGESVRVNGAEFTVEETGEHAVEKIRVKRLPSTASRKSDEE